MLTEAGFHVDQPQPDAEALTRYRLPTNDPVFVAKPARKPVAQRFKM